MKSAHRVVLVAAMAVLGGMACDELATELENTAPSAVASAPLSTSAGSDVTLDGSNSSDSDGDDLTYAWTLLSTPTGSSATLTGANTAQATFPADAVGEFVAELEVSDGSDSDADTATVMVTNETPVAVAAPSDTVAAGGDVTLDASSSTDGDANQTLTYTWSLEAPTGSAAALSSTTAPMPTFTADLEGTYLAILTVSDGFETAVDTAVIEALDPGQPPVINSAGEAGNIAFGVPHQVGVDATDPEGASLTYQWSLISGPGSLTFPDSTGADQADTANIQVSAAGEYEIEVAVADLLNVVTDTLTFQAYDPELSDVTADTTIVKLLNSDYSANTNIDVSAALTLEPGVVARFGANLRFSIATGGSLSAVGTAQDSIRILGAQESAGYWDGLQIATVDMANELAYVEIAHGGDAGLANVYVTGSGQIAIHDSRLHSSDQEGVEVVTGGSLEGFSANTLRDNALGALRIPAGVVGQLDNASSYGVLSGDRIVIFGSTAAAAATWPAADIPFLVDGNVTLQNVITVEPGAEFHVEQNNRITVESGGALNAVGTMADTIRFVGEQASGGYWDGIDIRTVNAANELTYTELAHGGDAGLASVYVSGSGSVKITNSRIHDSGQEGIEVVTGGSLTSFSQNTFADNPAGAVRLPVGNLGELDNASTYGAGSTGLYIDAFSGTASTAQTWPKTDVPILLSGNSTVAAAVTVEPGAHFQAGQNNRLTVSTGGSLTAIGTSTDTIRFVGAQDSYGYWDGIEIETTNADNKLIYTEVANGGDAGLSNVTVTGSGQLEVSNSLFRRSSADGLVVQSGGQLVNFASNKFEDNQGAALYVPAEEVGQLDGASDYAASNTSDFIRTNGTVSSDATWPSTNAPILVVSTMSIEAAVTVTPGADIWVEENDRITVTGANGALIADGTVSDTITFRGLQTSQNYWDGIDFETTNGNIFNYVDIGHGGSGGLANVYVSAAGGLTMSNSFSHDSGTYGVYVESGGAFVDGGGNSYNNNQDGNVQIIP